MLASEPLFVQYVISASSTTDIWEVVSGAFHAETDNRLDQTMPTQVMRGLWLGDLVNSIAISNRTIHKLWYVTVSNSATP